jgi:hypothetical protein
LLSFVRSASLPEFTVPLGGGLMATVHTHYVTYDRKGGRRLHAGTATDDIVAPLTTITPAGGTYGAWASPTISWSDANGTHSADFAFWSIVGAADGASVSTAQSLSITVGDSDVQAVAWYLPRGGGNGPPGGPAFYIDAFDIDAGRFFDEDFVTITPDAGLTANANETGVVPTTSAEDVHAVASIEGVPFLDWTKFVDPGPQVISGEDLHADEGSTVLAFAFYQTPVGATPRVPGHYGIGGTIVGGVARDGSGGIIVGGHYHPIGPWNPLLATLAVVEAAKALPAEVRFRVQREAMQGLASYANQVQEELKSGLEARG